MKSIKFSREPEKKNNGRNIFIIIVILALLFGFKDRIQKNQEIPLVSKYPKVYDILSKGSLSELYFLGKEDVRFKISFLKLVVPKSENIFKNLTIPESSSKDGQEHIVQNEEEFLEYYQGNLKEK